MNITMPTGAEFFDRLCEAFEEAGLGTTQVEIAKLVGVNQSAVSKWKNNESYPSVETALRAATVSKVSVAWLYLGIGNKREDDEMDKLTWALLRTMAKLPVADRRELLDLAEIKAARSKGDGPKKVEGESEGTRLPHHPNLDEFRSEDDGDQDEEESEAA
jgi:transcriptional regulator with XRE-family HTH domain